MPQSSHGIYTDAADTAPSEGKLLNYLYDCQWKSDHRAR